MPKDHIPSPSKPPPPPPQYFHRLDGIDRLALFHSLTASFGVQAAEVDAAAASWQALRAQHAQPPSGLASGTAALGGEPLVKAAAALAAAATPRYARLFVPLSQQPGGIKFLVDVRADLLQVGGVDGGQAGRLFAALCCVPGCLVQAGLVMVASGASCLRPALNTRIPFPL